MSSTVHRILRDSVEQPYQGLFADFSSSGRIRWDKDDKFTESSRADVEGMNGKTAWILSVDAQTRILQDKTSLNKNSPLNCLESFLSQNSPE